MKKIVTVSVLAIMAVSAARADIASTTYVDNAKSTLQGAINLKADTSVVTELAGRVTTAEGGISTNATEIAKKAAQADVNTLTEKVGDVSLSGTNYMSDDTNLTAAVKSLDTALSNVVAGEVDTTKIPDGSIAEAKLKTELQEKINTIANAATNNAEAIETIESTYATQQALTAGLNTKVNTADVGTLSVSHAATADSATTAGTAGTAGTATLAAGYTENGAIAQALDGKVDDSEIVDMAKTSDIHNAALTIKVNGTEKGSFTANASTAAEVDIPVPTKVSDLENDANYQTAGQVTSTLGSYYTKTEADTLLNAKVATDTFNNTVGTLATKTALEAVTVTADSASSQAATNKTDIANLTGRVSTNETNIGTNTTNISTNTTNIGTLTTTLDSVKNLGVNGNIVAPAECKTGKYSCTLVMKYDAQADSISPVWEKIAE